MNWKKALTIIAASVLAVALTPSLVRAIQPFLTNAISFPPRSDMGSARCPTGPQADNCIDNAGEVPKWHYQDGGVQSIAVGAGGGGSGTVTSVAAGTGMSFSTITTTGTVTMANTAVTPASYTYAGFTVDQQGRLTAAASGATPALAATTISAGTGMTGGGSLASNRTLTLADTAVTPGSYTNSNLTVDQQGRITAASNGSGSGSTFATTYSATPADNLITTDNTGGPVEFFQSVGTAQTASVLVKNTTAATSGNQKWSPAIELDGNGFGTTGSASQAVSATLQLCPVQGLTAGGDVCLYQKNGGGSLTAGLEIANNITNSTATNASLVIGTSGAGAISFDSANGGQLFMWKSVASFRADDYPLYRFNLNAGILPGQDVFSELGLPGARWYSVSSRLYDTKLGAQLTAASTITPTTGFHHITGATHVTTIAATNMIGNSDLTLVGDDIGGITISVGGNVGAAVLIAQNTAQRFIYDIAVTTWYPVP